MKLTILGTGNATVSECYNTCYAISDEGKHFLVDAGGGNRILKVLKDTGIDMNDIHDIFVTHEHVDHVLGIIWLVRMIGQRMNQGKYEGDLRIYCHEELAENLTSPHFNVMEPIWIDRNEEFLVTPEILDKMLQGKDDVDIYMIGPMGRLSDLVIDFVQKAKKPIIRPMSVPIAIAARSPQNQLPA